MKKIIALIFLYTFNMYGSDAANLSSGRWQTTPSDISLQIIKHAKHPTEMYKTLRVLSKQNRAACSQESFIDNMMVYMSSTKKKDIVLLAVQIATPEMVSSIHRRIDTASDKEKRKYKKNLRKCEKQLAQGQCIGHKYSRINRCGLFKRQLVVASSILDKNVYKNALIGHVLNHDADSLDRYLGLRVHADPDYEKQFGKADIFLNELLYCCVRNLVKELSIRSFEHILAMFRVENIDFKIDTLCKMISCLKKSGARPVKHHQGLLRSFFPNGKLKHMPNRLEEYIELAMPNLDDEKKFEMYFKKIYPDIKE